MRATQCLTDFSLDFERTGVDTGRRPGLTVNSHRRQRRARGVTSSSSRPIPATRTGRTTPTRERMRPAQVNPVGGNGQQPAAPACTPEVTGKDVNAQNGDPCPANKLVITPSGEHPGRHAVFKVTVFYTGRPGVHTDGDGSTEGWFRNDKPPGDGGFVTTEPVGTEDWMPLNNHPSAKPTYDFYDTVNAGPDRGRQRHAALHRAQRVRTPSSRGGSTTWHWHSPAPIASYLVENSVGSYST